MISKIRHSLILAACVLAVSCTQPPGQAERPEPVELPDEPLQLNFLRFEKELMKLSRPVDTGSIRQLRERYGDFMEIWCTQLSGLLPAGAGKPPDMVISDNLGQYLEDRYISEVFEDCSREYDNIEGLQDELSAVFGRYQKAFPGKKIPSVTTYVSPFTSNVITMDTLLGIGLHFYLGSGYRYYPTLQLPGYMMKKMSREYIVNDLVKGWLDSDYLDDTSRKDCLSQMIYQGKTLFAMDILSPGTPDTIKTGYSEKQLEWAFLNEARIWGFFIEQGLLFSTNPKVYIKYIHDGNTTQGFPKDAPARLGAFIGWQIVRAYMKKNPGLNLKALFEEKDASRILNGSSYKPRKPES